MCGSDHTNAKGAIIEDILSTEYVVLLNTDAPIQFNLQYGSLRTIDLSLSRARSAISYTWEPFDDMYTSNHYPLKIQSTSILNTPLTTYKHWNLISKALYCANVMEQPDCIIQSKIYKHNPIP